jgi:DNA-binding MarR family transcriptional regulator
MALKNRSKNDLDEFAQFQDQIDRVRTFFIVFTDKALSLNSLNGQRADSDFKLSQIKTLSAFLPGDRAYSMGELSERIGVATPRMTLLVDDLEKSGIVQRMRDKKDRRIVKVQLTKKGKGLLREFNVMRRRETENLLHRLSKSDRKELLSALDRAVKVLKKLDVR